jgi:hypothetical protein
VQDQPNTSETRALLLDQEVERLTSEVASLKLELATLVSAVHEIQAQQLSRRLPARYPPPAPLSKPSAVPAGVVVLAFAGLLSWQVLTSPPRAEHPTAATPAPHVDAAPLAPLAPFPMAPMARVAPMAPYVYRGTLSVSADQPVAEVFINREKVGTAPVRVRNLRAGSHLVWVESEGHRRWTRVVTVPAEKVTRVSVALEPLERIEHDPQ